MKKYFTTFFLVLVLASPAFAARIKYNIVTGDIIAMSQTKDNKVGTNEALLDVPDEVKTDIQNYKVDADGKFRKKTAEEIATDQASKDKDKADRKARKKNVMTKLGLDKPSLKALIELIQDGSDD